MSEEINNDPEVTTPPSEDVEATKDELEIIDAEIEGKLLKSKYKLKL